MATHRTLVGLHARNDVRFQERDYELIRLARIENLKMMSFTDTSVYARLRREHPGIEFIVRLYDERISANSRPSPWSLSQYKSRWHAETRFAATVTTCVVSFGLGRRFLCNKCVNRFQPRQMGCMKYK